MVGHDIMDCSMVKSPWLMGFLGPHGSPGSKEEFGETTVAKITAFEEGRDFPSVMFQYFQCCKVQGAYQLSVAWFSLCLYMFMYVYVPSAGAL